MLFCSGGWAMRYLVGILAGVVITVGVVAAASGVDESSADVVEGPNVCEAYGDAMDDILVERFPAENDPVLLARKTGGVPLIGYLTNATPPQMDWDCAERRLTVIIRGPWTLGAADMESALEVLLRDLRSRELNPMMDRVEVVLESQLMDDSARFDGAAAEKAAESEE